MDNRPNLVLDLDQTLISAEAAEDLDMSKYSDKTKLFRVDDMDGYYWVYSRPHLQEFLDYIFGNFKVTIWTAASKDYALFIIQKVILNNIAERKLEYIFYSYHCELSKHDNPEPKDIKKKYSKDLCMLWTKHNLPGFTVDNTFILDDYTDDVHKCQPDRCIIAPAFEFTSPGSENDTFLRSLIPKLEKLKAKVETGHTEGLTSDINQ